MILPLISAILGIVAFSPLNAYAIGFIFLIPLFVFYMKEYRFWRLIMGTILFRVLLLLGTVYYTLEPINWTWSIIIFLGLPLSVYGIKKYIQAWNMGIAIPFLWVLFDHLQAQYALVPTYIITAGNIVGSSPFVGVAKPFGIIALTALVAIVNGLFASAYCKKGRARYILVLLALLCIGTALRYSQVRLNRPSLIKNADTRITIASIATDKTFDLSDAYALERALMQAHADLIVLPESMIDELGNKDPERWYRETAKMLRTPIIATVQLERNGSRRVSTEVIEPDGSISGTHDKARLTFMGEYWPLGSWRPSFIDWLAAHDPQIKSYAIVNPDRPYVAGSKNILTVKVKGISINIASLICMEVQYPYDLLFYKKAGAQLIITPTSNRWIDTGSAQFKYLTNNLRTIESVSMGIPLIVSGVNDDPGMITPDGKTTLLSKKQGDASYSIATSTLSF